MNKFYYQRRCVCTEELFISKKLKLNKISEGKPLQYPRSEDSQVPHQTQIFQIKYDKRLSFVAKSILNSFRNKYIYYAIDDILYLWWP